MLQRHALGRDRRHAPDQRQRTGRHLAQRRQLTSTILAGVKFGLAVTADVLLAEDRDERVCAAAER
ncbi:hypothetical protein ACFQZ8_00080 [Micromonospora azadirachtae]|uniref:Uncharacterized protein n=1 Tax=Micromonospora azadirachtae TaxID=1970735 RepID=A0ABW2ZUK1_9ACTN